MFKDQPHYEEFILTDVQSDDDSEFDRVTKFSSRTRRIKCQLSVLFLHKNLK